MSHDVVSGDSSNCLGAKWLPEVHFGLVLYLHIKQELLEVEGQLRARRHTINSA